MTSVDQQGNLLLFYSGLDCAALDAPDPSYDVADRGTAVRTLDLGDAGAPVLGERRFVTTAGLTPEPFLPNSGRFLHHASWAYVPRAPCRPGTATSPVVSSTAPRHCDVTQAGRRCIRAYTQANYTLVE